MPCTDWKTRLNEDSDPRAPPPRSPGQLRRRPSRPDPGPARGLGASGPEAPVEHRQTEPPERDGDEAAQEHADATDQARKLQRLDGRVAGKIAAQAEGERREPDIVRPSPTPQQGDGGDKQQRGTGHADDDIELEQNRFSYVRGRAGISHGIKGSSSWILRSEAAPIGLPLPALKDLGFVPRLQCASSGHCHFADFRTCATLIGTGCTRHGSLRVALVTSCRRRERDAS